MTNANIARLADANNAKRSFIVTNGLIDKGHLFDEEKDTSEEFFSQDIEPELTPSLVRIYITLDAPAKVSALIKQGVTTVPQVLNQDTALDANVLYVLDVVLQEGQALNYSLDEDNIDVTCSVVESVQYV